eukprot:PhM_4_TR494/c0_g1_i1/m.10263/K15361/WDR48, UAF1; WD repeat-containing protein 48
MMNSSFTVPGASAGSPSAAPVPVRSRKLSYFLDWSPHKGHKLGVNAVEPIPELGILVSGGRDGTVRVWSPQNENTTRPSTRLLWTSCDHTHSVQDICVVTPPPTSPVTNGSGMKPRLVSCSTDTMVRMYEVVSSESSATLRTLESHPMHTDTVTSVASDYHHICSGSLDTRCVVTDSMLRPVTIVKGVDSLYSVCIENSLLMLGHSTGKILAYDVRAPQMPSMRLSGHTDVVRKLDLSFSSSRGAAALLSAGSDGKIKHWDLRTGRTLVSIQPHVDSLWSFSRISQRGDPAPMVVSGGRDASLMLTHMCPSAAYTRVVALCDAPILDVAVSGTNIVNRRVWSSHTTSTINCFDLSSGGLEDSSTSSVATASTASPSRVSLSINDVELRPDQTQPGHNTFTLNDHSIALITPSFDTSEEKSLWTSSQQVAVHRRMDVTKFRPSMQILGCPAVVRCSLLSNRRTVLTLTDESVATLWDIVTMKRIKDLGPIASPKEYDSILKTYDTSVMFRSSNWCQVEVRMGHMCVTLDGQECFTQESTAYEMDFGANEWSSSTPRSSRELPPDQRHKYRTEETINVGVEVLNTLRTPQSPPHCIVVTGSIHDKERFMVNVVSEFVVPADTVPAAVTAVSPSTTPEAASAMPLPGETTRASAGANGGAKHQHHHPQQQQPQQRTSNVSPASAVVAINTPLRAEHAMPMPNAIFERAFSTERLEVLRHGDSRVPSWATENAPGPRGDQSKLSIQLIPCDPRECPVLGSAAKVTAGKSLPVYKVSEYIAEKGKINLNSVPGGWAEDLIEVVVMVAVDVGSPRCGTPSVSGAGMAESQVPVTVDPLVTLNCVHRFLKNPSSMKLYYRRLVQPQVPQAPVNIQLFN